MRRSIVLLALTTLLSGCAAVPFRPADRISIAKERPEQLLARFQDKLPATVNSFNSVVFEFAGQTFLGLGFIEIDRREQRFRVVCLNPMGVKLFDLSGDGRSAVIGYAIEPLAQYRAIGDMVAADIRRIYFDQLPPATAIPCQGEFRIFYGNGVPGGYQERIFAGSDGDLVEKRFYNADQLLSWRVSYHEFVDRGGKRYPRGILLTNYQDGYQLSVREKEQEVTNDQE